MSSGNHRIVDLLQLQNLTKRDPAAYKEEFTLQHQHFLTQLQIFQLKPTKDFKPFAQLVSYLSHVCSLYPKEMVDFPKQIADLLENNCNNLEPDLRRILAKSLILMRNRNMMQQIPMLTLFFKLFRIHDKPLRKLLYSYIITDIKNTNLKHKNVKLNKTLQNFMYTMMNDSSEIATLMSLKVMIELFRKKIWHDIKTVNVISNGVFSKNSKIVTTTLNFFLHVDNPDKEDDSDREDAKRQEDAKQQMRKASLANKVAKKTKARSRRLGKAKDDYKKILEANDKKTDPNFPAIELIHDPQSYAERIYSVLRRTTEKFETRLLMMNFISRLIHVHKLLVYNFYPFLQKYIQPHQKNITYILAVLAQSCHDLVDPEIIKPVIRAIATYFVNDGSNPEVIAIGLNTIRNICQRCPLAMDPVLLQDLVMYKDKKEKGVMMAGRSLLQFFRDYYPSMLKKKDRGNRSTDKAPLLFGQTVVSTGVEGIELLYDEELKKKFEAYQAGEFELSDDDEDEDEDEDGDEWVTDEDDDGEWVTDDEDEEVEDEGEGAADEDEDEEGEEWVTDDEEEGDDEDDGEEWQDVEEDEDEVPTLVKNGQKAPAVVQKSIPKKQDPKKSKKVQQVEEEEEEEEEEVEDDDSGEWLDVDEDLIDQLNNGEWEEVDDDDEDEDEDDEDEDEDDDDEEEEEESFENENEAIENEERENSKEKKEKPKKEDDDLGIKILSDEDLILIKQLKLFKEALENKNKRKEFTQDGDDSEDEENELGYIDASDLTGAHKRKRATKAERLKSVMEGREGREEYKSKKARKDTYGKSIRNELKAKLTKPFLLTKQSTTVRAKQFMSMRDKQMAKQTHAVGQKNYSR